MIANGVFGTSNWDLRHVDFNDRAFSKNLNNKIVYFCLLKKLFNQKGGILLLMEPLNQV